MSFLAGAGCSAAANPAKKLSQFTNTSLQRPSTFPNASSTAQASASSSQSLTKEATEFEQFKSFNASQPLNSTSSPSSFSQSYQASTAQHYSLKSSATPVTAQWNAEFAQFSRPKDSQALQSPFQNQSTFHAPPAALQNPLVFHSSQQVPEYLPRVVPDSWDEQFSLAEKAAKQLHLADKQEVGTEQTTVKSSEKTLEEKWQDHQKELERLGKAAQTLEEYQSQWESFLETQGMDAENYRTSDANFSKSIPSKLSAANSIEQLADSLKGKSAYDRAIDLINKQGSYAEACVLLEVAVLQDSKNANAWAKLGWMHTMLGNDSRSAEAFRNYVALQPNDHGALLELAVAYVNTERTTEALLTIEHWLHATFPDMSSKFKQISGFYDSQDGATDIDKMRACLLETIYSNQSDKLQIDLQSALGLMMFLSGDFEKAYDCYHYAVEHNPTKPEYWNKQGASATNCERHVEGIESYKSALRVMPQFVRPLSNLAISSINLRCYKEATDYILEALDLVNDKKGILANCESNVELWGLLRKVLLIGLERTDLASLAKPGGDINYIRSKVNEIERP
ncbi:peroxisomal targeting signal receptor Pex5 [Schizosaccharomyces japonicus yFS275]|uniref:Peroxisomal targeting signal receptor Pex5 n=1 Tax=Schizosaccharomyces japonicus (strain yFS275 / FY16936) TaxID=402676 RepID=B6JWC8_SCHJY|nr:peroxisomal targeting signal receptor Pex5 [Schizosaccharomyces japonicus yFS275]EEB05679.2 peroxisomal targeting signal receptor Pex5 [Schizosaccharomyces japonicus yFS275]